MENEKEKKVEKSEVINNHEVISQPVVIFDGKCDHEWEFIFKDGDGRNNYGCKKCPMGKAENA